LSSLRPSSKQATVDDSQIFTTTTSDLDPLPLEDWKRSITQPAGVFSQDYRLTMSALAQNVSELDLLEEDLVKALDDLEHEVDLTEFHRPVFQWLFGRRGSDVPPTGGSTLRVPLLRPTSPGRNRSAVGQLLKSKRKFLRLIDEAIEFSKQNSKLEGIGQLQQRAEQARRLLDVDTPKEIREAVRLIRRIFPFEVDPLDDMPYVSVYMCSLRVRWSYFFICALFTALALFAGSVTEVFFAVFASDTTEEPDCTACLAASSEPLRVWISLWLLPFGAMFLALVGDEMGDLVIDAIDRPPLLWCLSLVLTALYPDRKVAPSHFVCVLVDYSVIILSELVPLTCAVRGRYLGIGFWHGYMQGGLLAAFIVTLGVLLADLTICIYGLESGKAQQALRHIYHVLDKHKIFGGVLSSRYDLFKSHFEQAQRPRRRDVHTCKRWAELLEVSGRAVAGVSSTMAAVLVQRQHIVLIVTVVAWTIVSMLAVQKRFSLPELVSAGGMIITVSVLSMKTAAHFPQVAGPFYTVILAFFLFAAFGLQAWTAFGFDVEHAAVMPLMWTQNSSRWGRISGRMRRHESSLPRVWEGNETLQPQYTVCRLSWGSVDAPVSSLDLAALAMLSYEPSCTRMSVLLENTFGPGVSLETCNRYEALPRWISVRFPPKKSGGRGTRVFAVKGTSTWRDIYADIKLYATIQVLQSLSKVVPILSLLPVRLVQSIVGFTNTAEKRLWTTLEDAIQDQVSLGEPVVLTGHSLGGSIAQIAAARLQLSAIVWSAPGIVYSARRFDVEPEKARHVVAVVPDGDVVAQVDEQAGILQRIACREKNGQLGSTTTCHKLTKTACDLWRVCGDPTGRDFSDSCEQFVSPESLRAKML